MPEALGALVGRTAIVTGGASGIGAAIVRAFVHEGAHVAVFDLNEGAAREVAGDIGTSVIAVGVDVTKPVAVDDAVTSTISNLRRIDILVNCAGLNRFTPPDEIDPQQWRQIIGINLDGPWNLCAAVIPHFKEQGHGRIVNVASVAGILGIPKAAHYTAAKHGLVGLTRALAVDLGPFNINVNCICPGTTLTPLVEQATSDTFKAEAVRRTPLRRLGQPEDLANAAVFLASDAASWITGAVLPVDGGMTACIRSEHWE